MTRLWLTILFAAALGITAACAPGSQPGSGAAAGQPAAASDTAAGGATTSQAVAGQQATLRLDWFVVGNNSMYYLALDRGYYRDEGIDVEIGPGKGSSSTAQIIGSGAEMFGVVDTGTAALAIARGVPITVIATWAQTSPIDITVLDSSDIQTPGDLKGKRVGASPGSAGSQLLPAYLKANGLSPSDITIVNVEPTAKWSALSEGKVDGIEDFITSSAPIVEVRAGKKVRTLMFADSGVNVLGTGLVVSNDVLTSNPDLVERFVRATVKGWQAAIEQPEEAVAAGLARSESGDKEVFMRQLTDTFKLLHTRNSAGKPLGWMSEADWDQSLKLLKEYSGLEGDRPAREYYTNDFIPQT